jgi:hypothetical protein
MNFFISSFFGSIPGSVETKILFHFRGNAYCREVSCILTKFSFVYFDKILRKFRYYHTNLFVRVKKVRKITRFFLFSRKECNFCKISLNFSAHLLLSYTYFRKLSREKNIHVFAKINANIFTKKVSYC